MKAIRANTVLTTGGVALVGILLLLLTGAADAGANPPEEASFKA